MSRTPGNDAIRRDAAFDATGQYRYSLTRAWLDIGAGTVCFVLLNPSIADAAQDDPTIRRCIGFARNWGFARLEVVNLFAYRTRSPKELRCTADPVGEENDRFLLESAGRADCVVAGWGIHGAFLGRSDQVRRLLLSRACCLGYTVSREPRHPLNLPAHAERITLCP